MDEQSAINMINNVFEEENIPMEFSDISDIENFLNNEDNMKLEVYGMVEQVYSQLIDEFDFEEDVISFE